MNPVYSDGSVVVYEGDCRPLMATLPDESVDSVVTDPPYELAFMGRVWDRTGVAFDAETWRQCLRLLKPGGHLLAFGGTRTWHRLTSAIEDAGFEIRDSIAWLHGEGFPKSLNLGDGRGTALKPAFEPVVVARKPLSGTVAANLSEHGTGPLNIDLCRVQSNPDENLGRRNKPGANGWKNSSGGENTAQKAIDAGLPQLGRWPTNVVIDDSTAAAIDKDSGITRDGTHVGRNRDGNAVTNEIYGARRNDTRDVGYHGEGGASRFFPTFKYQAKADPQQRPTANGVSHPTVKPLDLMRWLVRLVTPPNGVVLDPFAGSGTTAEACIHEHKRAIVIERDADYLPLIISRLSKPMAVGFDFEEPA